MRYWVSQNVPPFFLSAPPLVCEVADVMARFFSSLTESMVNRKIPGQAGFRKRHLQPSAAPIEEARKFSNQIGERRDNSGKFFCSSHIASGSYG